MSSLNLMPNVPVLLVQTGLFLVGYALVKKLFVEPYRKVRTAQQQLTGGADGLAQELTTTAASAEKRVLDRLQNARLDVAKAAEELRQNAAGRRTVLLAAAEKKAQESLAQSQQEIQSELAREMATLPKIVEKLSADIVTKILSDASA